MKLNEVEQRIVDAAPEGWLDQPPPPICTVRQCIKVKHAWGTCMCLLIRGLQNERAKSGSSVLKLVK